MDNPRNRLLIVEDHQLVADAMCQLLSGHAEFDIVGVANDGLSAYAVCQQVLPELVLLDLALPGMDGIDVIHTMRRRWPELPVVVLTAFTDTQRCRASLDAGAQGYVLKHSPLQVLLTALHHVLAGKLYIDPDMPALTEASGENGVAVNLTLRERQVLKLVAEGKRNRDIAELLSISIKTVETHRLNLMRKLDAHNVIELSVWAVKLGTLV